MTVEIESLLEEGFFGEMDCSDPEIGGIPSSRFDFVPKHHNEDILDDVNLDLKPRCEPWYYYNMKVGNLLALENVDALGNVTSNGGAHVLSAKKNFDIPHPLKPNWRLRHTCIEGPENNVYFRGTATIHQSSVNRAFVPYPDYWINLVDINTMTIHLNSTDLPLILSYELSPTGFIIKGLSTSHMSWGEKTVTKINYLVIADRSDGDKLIPEYEGETPADYPGDNSQYSISGYDYDVKVRPLGGRFINR